MKYPNFSSQQVRRGQKDWEKAPDMEHSCDRGSGGIYKLHFVSKGPSEFAEKHH